MEDDGTVVIATTSAFSLDIKKVLINDLIRAKDLIKSTGGSASEAPLVYYVDDPYSYRNLTYDFTSPFALKLFVPECTLENAMLTVTGVDYVNMVMYYGTVKTPGQHYSIDDKEVSGCDAIVCELNRLSPGGGISCVPGKCEIAKGSYDSTWVSVNPVDITDKIAPGLHKVSASGIDNQHTMIIEAVTSPSEDEMLLYSDDYKTMINETRSSPMTKLYALLQPNAEVLNKTSTTMIANATI
jgi:hypothetical protein